MLFGFPLLGLLILAIFAVGAWLMITRKLPALLTLPLMGVLIVVIAAAWTGKITSADIVGGVMPQGAYMLHEAMIVSFIGGMVSFLLQKSGVAHSLVRQAAELIGDNPLGVALFTLALLALLFTSIGGLGAIIMVSLVVLPMMATVGIPPVVAGSIMLIGLSLGGILNPGNWIIYTQTMDVPLENVKRIAAISALQIALMGVIFICVELWRAGAVRKVSSLLSTMLISLIALGGLGWFLLSRNVSVDEAPPLTFAQLREMGIGGAVAHGEFWTLLAQVGVGLFFAAILLLILIDLKVRVRRWRHQVVTVKWYAYLIPIVPLLCVFLYGMPVLTAFVVSFVYAVLVTLRPGSVSMTVQSMIQGSSSVMPAVILMIGIGILIKSLLGPSGWSAAHDGAMWPVHEALAPIFAALTPKVPLLFVIGFSLAAPLALYRGPLNVWGLGFPVGAILLSAGLPGPAIVAMLLTVGQVQGICDPTNTHNVWLANELRVDVKSLMFRTLPYVWVMVFVGLTIAALFLIDWKVPDDETPPAAASVVSVLEGGVS